MRYAAVPLVLAGMVLSFGTVPAREETVPSPAAQELLEHERVRAAVESLLREVASSAPDADPYAATDRIVALGPPVVPFMVSELTAPLTPFFPTACDVLGRVKTPESTQALRDALEAANRDASTLAGKRKLWAVYGLALQGDPEAVDLLDAGERKAARSELFERMSGIEVAAVLTAPASVPRLLKQLEVHAASPENDLDAAAVLDALGWIGDPSTAGVVGAQLRNPSPRVRVAAARAYGLTAGSSAADRLLALLDDKEEKDDGVREAAAFALQDLAPKEKVDAMLARLAVENDTNVRGALYRTLAVVGGERMVEPLRACWGRPDWEDRSDLLAALGILGSRKSLNILRSALRDKDDLVVLQAAESLHEIGGSGAVDTLLALLGDGRWPVVESAIDHLVNLHEERAAPRIAERLLRERLSGPVTDPAARSPIRIMGDALVSMHFTDPLPAIREAARVQTDPPVVSYLQGLIKRLGVLDANKDDRDRWIRTLESPDPEIRGLGYGRLGDLGGSGAVKALMGTFDRVSRDEGVEILRALGRIRSAEGAPLVERVLLDDAFDAHPRRPLRNMAAWAARQIGGARMVDALKRCAERREGRDMDVLVYLGVLAGPDSLPTLRSVRVVRLRHFELTRGLEEKRLDWMIRELSAGRPIRSLDDTPDRLEFH